MRVRFASGVWCEGRDSWQLVLKISRVYNYIVHLTEGSQFKWDLEEQITDETLIVFNGEIRQNGKTE